MMASVHYLTPPTPPMPAVARILARFNRESLSGFIEVAIGLLDVMEPDPDLEDSETGSNLIDTRGRFLGDDQTAGMFDDCREPDDEDHEDDGREREEGF